MNSVTLSKSYELWNLSSLYPRMKETVRKIVHTSNLGLLQNGQKRNSDTILKATRTQYTVTGMLSLIPVTRRNRLAFPRLNISDQLNIIK
jgi:hypothetical protein